MLKGVNPHIRLVRGTFYMKIGNIGKKEFDTSNQTTVSLAIELPYWISIKSGEYTLQNNKSIGVRNDYWLVSTENIADNPDPFPDFIVNEEQVIDSDFLRKKTAGRSQYYHKRKMNTTFTRSHSVIPMKGVVVATPLSEEWKEQLEFAVFGILQQQSVIEKFLEDANLFINLYSTLISPQNPSREVRQVSFYETMIHVRIICRTESFHFENLTRISPDWKTAGQPFPPSRVRDHTILETFKETLQNCSPPEFHQLVWLKTLNYRREKRYQDALLHASITLEALVHLYLSARGITSRKKRIEVIKKAKGLGNWFVGLNIEGLKNELENVANLRSLRNDVVHKEKVLTNEDIELVKSGVQSLALVRTYLLQASKPEVLQLENKFNSFLEPIEQGKSVSPQIGTMVLLRYGWRKEKDCYKVITEHEQ
jgi:hypothetical protein